MEMPRCYVTPRNLGLDWHWHDSCLWMAVNEMALWEIIPFMPDCPDHFALPPLPLLAASVPGQTDKLAAQQGSWITVKNLLGLPSSLPSRVGDSCFSFRLSLQTLSGSAYQFSHGMAKTETTCGSTAYPVSLQYRPQSQASRWAGGVHMQGLCCTVGPEWCIWNGQRWCVETQSLAFCEEMHWSRK